MKYWSSVRTKLDVELTYLYARQRGHSETGSNWWNTNSRFLQIFSVFFVNFLFFLSWLVLYTRSRQSLTYYKRIRGLPNRKSSKRILCSLIIMFHLSSRSPPASILLIQKKMRTYRYNSIGLFEKIKWPIRYRNTRDVPVCQMLCQIPDTLFRRHRNHQMDTALQVLVHRSCLGFGNLAVLMQTDRPMSSACTEKGWGAAGHHAAAGAAEPCGSANRWRSGGSSSEAGKESPRPSRILQPSYVLSQPIRTRYSARRQLAGDVAVRASSTHYLRDSLSLQHDHMAPKLSSTWPRTKGRSAISSALKRWISSAYHWRCLCKQELPPHDSTVQR